MPGVQSIDNNKITNQTNSPVYTHCEPHETRFKFYEIFLKYTQITHNPIHKTFVFLWEEI